MKNKALKPQKEHKIPQDIINQLIKITQDSKFQTLIERAKKIDSDPDTKGLFDHSKDVEKYIQENNLPLNWKQPMLNMIRYDVPDFPVDNGIEIMVGNQVITGNHNNLLLITDAKTGQFNIEKKISIVITSKMKTERILQFIKGFKEVIEQVQNTLNFPDFYKSNWQKLPLAQKIIALKDKDGLTFSEISDKLSSDKTLTVEENDYFANVNNIKSLYYDYKKYLASK